MCDPMTILTVASGGMQFMGAMSQASDVEATAAYNARVKENEATDVRNKAVEEENIHREKVAQLLGKQRAQLGASGISLGSGSALGLLEETEVLGEVDALRIKKNFLDQAHSLDDQGNLITIEGSNKASGIRTGAFGSLLTTAGAGISAGADAGWFDVDSAAMQGTLTDEEFAIPVGGF